MIGFSALGLAASAASLGPNCADRIEIDPAISAVCDVISGQRQKRDFERMRSLLASGATPKAIGPKGLRGGSLEDYFSRNKDVLEREGFTKLEPGRRVEIRGDLATARSAYDGRTANCSVHERGINSFQLVKIDRKWLGASILWQEETPQTSLPAQLIQGSTK